MRCVCLIAFLAAATLAAEPSGPAGPSGTPRHDATHRARPHAFVGEVVTVNPVAGTFSGREALRDGSPKTTTFQVDAKTRIVRGKDSCTIADIRPFDHVTVKYAEETGGRHHAMTVTVTPALNGTDPHRSDSSASR